MPLSRPQYLAYLGAIITSAALARRSSDRSGIPARATPLTFSS